MWLPVAHDDCAGPERTIIGLERRTKTVRIMGSRLDLLLGRTPAVEDEDMVERVLAVAKGRKEKERIKVGMRGYNEEKST